MEYIREKFKDPASLDVLKVLAFIAIVTNLGLYFEFPEFFMKSAQHYEKWEVDDIIASTVLSAVLAMAWYSFRRLKESVNLAQDLRLNEGRLRSLIDSTDASIYLIDREYHYIVMNRKHMSRLHIETDDYIGKHFIAFHSPEETRLFIEKADTVFRTGAVHTYEYQSTKDGRYFYQVYSPINNDTDETVALTVISSDITERKHMENELRELTLNDELTGVYNRRGFTTLAEQYLRIADREGRGLYMLYGDMDNLKIINDKFGHGEGDFALKEIARILKDHFRKSDIVGRIGGDEFAVMPIGYYGDNTEMILSKLKKKLDSYNLRSDRLYKLSISVGIAYYNPENPCSLDDLLSESDKAMYEQKKSRAVR